MNATLAGQDPEQAAYGKKVPGITDETLEPETDTQDEEVSEPTDTTDASVSGEDDNDSSESGEPIQQSAANSDKDIETVALKFRDPKTGRQQKIEVNYSDRAAIKKAFMEAAGMRKFQAERDHARKQISDIQSKYDELNGIYSQLDEAFQKDGAKGVVALLNKDPNAWENAVKQELEHKEYLANLTPAEKYRYEADKREKEYQARLEAAEKKNQEFIKSVEQREEQASLKSLESKLHPAFDRYRFSGKLGDPVVEHQFDEAIWNKVMTRLSEYPEDMELTQALVDREFREVSNNFKKIIGKQAEATVKKTIEKKKADASERVQAMAKKGLSGNNNADQKQFMADLKSGNIQDAFKAMFTGKAKI